MREKWLNEIPGLEHITGYKVTEDGTVMSFLKRNNHAYIISDHPRHTLKPMISKKGYLKVELKRKMYSIHRLVALAFIPNPKNKPQVNHKDGIKLHNYESNLEWVTCAENIQHAVRHGLHVSLKGDLHYTKSILTENHHSSRKVAQLTPEGILLSTFPSIKQASESVHMHYSGIAKCCGGRLEYCKRFKWKYFEDYQSAN